MPDRVYLDSCVVNRATDDHTQERIRLEASEIARVLDAISDGRIEWIASTVLTLELSHNPHPQKRADSLVLLSLASSVFVPNGETLTRSQQLRQQGYGPSIPYTWLSRSKLTSRHSLPWTIASCAVQPPGLRARCPLWKIL